MRKVVLYTLISADGAVEEPPRYFPDFDSRVDGLFADFLQTADEDSNDGDGEQGNGD